MRCRLSVHGFVAVAFGLIIVRADPEHTKVKSGPAAGSDAAGPIAALQHELVTGDKRLENEPGRGYLRALLAALGVRVSSQVLVFSKTSQQRELISPQTPRAIYFSDDIYVAWIPGSTVIELSDIHPTEGPRFYTLHQASPPVFTLRQDCIRCHDGLKTLGVPGYLMGSNFAAPDGQPLSAVAPYRGGHRSPLRVRWGGWYVTGTHAGELHLGNVCRPQKTRSEKLDPAAGANCTNLTALFDTSPYLSPDSDIVALLVLEHQLRMHNLISRLHRDAEAAQTDLESCPSAVQAGAAARERISPSAEALLEYLLFRDEAPLKGPVQGTSAFATEFERVGPWDSHGRSLRQLDLHHRLLRFPCSYLIYSAAFDALPSEAKEYLWQRLAEILGGQDQSQTYAGMASEDRRAVFEILRATKSEFAAWLRAH